MPNYELLKKSDSMEKKESNLGQYFMDFLTGKILQELDIQRVAGQMAIISLLALFIIGNTYYGQKQANKIETLHQELKELKYLHTATKERLLNIKKLSSLEQQLKERGLKTSTTLPKRITVKSE